MKTYYVFNVMSSAFDQQEFYLSTGAVWMAKQQGLAVEKLTELVTEEDIAHIDQSKWCQSLTDCDYTVAYYPENKTKAKKEIIEILEGYEIIDIGHTVLLSNPF